MTFGRHPLKVNQSSGFQMEERSEHSLLTPSIPSGRRRSWEDPEGKVGSPWCFSDGTVCYINIWHPAKLTTSAKSHYNSFNFFYLLSYNLMSLLKWHQNNEQTWTYHFQVFIHRGSGWDLFFLIGVPMFSSWWWWQEQNPLFTDVEHAVLVWASCVVFFLSFLLLTFLECI